MNFPYSKLESRQAYDFLEKTKSVTKILQVEKQIEALLDWFWDRLDGLPTNMVEEMIGKFEDTLTELTNEEIRQIYDQVI